MNEDLRCGVSIWPPEMWGHFGKGSSIPMVQLIRGGRIIRWDPTVVEIALTAVFNKRNRLPEIKRNEVTTYGAALFAVARPESIPGIRNMVKEFSHLVPQADEISLLPNETLVWAARLLTKAIW